MLKDNERAYVDTVVQGFFTKRLRKRVAACLGLGILTTTDPLTADERLNRWKDKDGPKLNRMEADQRTDLTKKEARPHRPGHAPKRGEKVKQMELFRAVPFVFFCCTFGVIFKDGFDGTPHHFDSLWSFSTYCLEVEVLNDRVLMTAEVGFDGRIVCPGIPEGQTIDATVELGLRGGDHIHREPKQQK